MKQQMVINLFFLLILMSCITQPIKKSDEQLQKIGYISICDTGKIYFYNSKLQDTLKGWGMIIFRFKNKNCNKIKIKSGKIMFLSLIKINNGDKVLEYNSSATKSLSDKEKRL